MPLEDQTAQRVGQTRKSPRRCPACLATVACRPDAERQSRLTVAWHERQRTTPDVDAADCIAPRWRKSECGRDVSSTPNGNAVWHDFTLATLIRTIILMEPGRNASDFPAYLGEITALTVPARLAAIA